MRHRPFGSAMGRKRELKDGAAGQVRACPQSSAVRFHHRTTEICINERQAKLPAPSEADIKAIESKHGKEMEELQQKMTSAMLRIAFDPKIQAELADIDMDAYNFEKALNDLLQARDAAAAAEDRDDGELSQIAPTILALLGLEQPSQMIQNSLLETNR